MANEAVLKELVSRFNTALILQQQAMKAVVELGQMVNVVIQEGVNQNAEPANEMGKTEVAPRAPRLVERPGANRPDGTTSAPR